MTYFSLYALHNQVEISIEMKHLTYSNLQQRYGHHTPFVSATRLFLDTIPIFPHSSNNFSLLMHFFYRLHLMPSTTILCAINTPPHIPGLLLNVPELTPLFHYSPAGE